MVKREQWQDAVAALARQPSVEIADFLLNLTDEQQQQLFGQLPVDLAAGALSHFPYYLQYVLLHTRTPADMRAILDEMGPNDRMQLLDELPEEAWQRLEEEIGDLGPQPEAGGTAEAGREAPALPKPLPAASQPQVTVTAPPAAGKVVEKQIRDLPVQEPEEAEAIIEGRGLEKSFPQP